MAWKWRGNGVEMAWKWRGGLMPHPCTKGFFGKDPGIGWSCDSTKINCPRGSGKVSNYMLTQKILNFKYQEWGFYDI
jgi:hypothetical protein